MELDKTKFVEKSTVRFLKSGIPLNSLFRKKTFIGYGPFKRITFIGGFPKPVKGIQYSKYVYVLRFCRGETFISTNYILIAK